MACILERHLDAARNRRIRRVGNPCRGTRLRAPEERVAVFDNDCTLWCEKPMPIQLDFILRHLAAMAEQEPALRQCQPWKASYGRDYAGLGGAMIKHYQGDDSDVKLLIGALQKAFGGKQRRKIQK